MFCIKIKFAESQKGPCIFIHPGIYLAHIKRYANEYGGIVMNKSDIKKVVLAYSGGLDTSIIIPWLKENYNN